MEATGGERRGLGPHGKAQEDEEVVHGKGVAAGSEGPRDHDEETGGRIKI
jgi:hypothetical protein